MKIVIPCLIIMFLMVGCGQKPGPLKAKASKDPKIAAAEEKINKTSPEGKEIIEKVQGMKPEVNEQLSSMTLKEKVEDYTKNKGDFGITPIGWEASKKKTERWKVLFYYQDYQKQLQTAEWEYDPKAEKVYPFEVNNAPMFWESAPPAQGTKGKK
ncbi:MAG: hypothetical protein ACLGJB_17315 [Blastocatellia bacterium]